MSQRSQKDLIFYSTTGKRITPREALLVSFGLTELQSFYEQQANLTQKETPKPLLLNGEKVSPQQISLWGAMGVLHTTPENRNYVIGNY